MKLQRRKDCHFLIKIFIVLDCRIEIWNSDMHLDMKYFCLKHCSYSLEIPSKIHDSCFSIIFVFQVDVYKELVYTYDLLLLMFGI